MEVKTDCFAYNSLTKQCTCLNELYCKKEKCHFYKDTQHMNRAHIESAIRSYANAKR